MPFAHGGVLHVMLLFFKRSDSIKEYLCKYVDGMHNQRERRGVMLRFVPIVFFIAALVILVAMFGDFSEER